MSLRVTQGMMHTQLLRNINGNMKRLDYLQNQLSTGRKINAPSDDPVGITFSMRYRSELASNDQYQQNVDAGISSIEYADTMLDQAGQVLHRVRELAVQGANGSNPETAMKAIKSEVEEMYNQLVDIGNSKFKGKYVFNGQMTDKTPYSENAAEADTTDTGTIMYEMGAGIKIPVNVTGSQVFGDPSDNDNAFKILKDLIMDLDTMNYQGVSDSLALIDSRTNRLLNTRAELGARTNRVELIQGRLSDININLQTLQSKTEDADAAEVITNLKMSENVYQSSLSVGAKLISPSLIDFLR